jgi:DMSO/TMAO reductase YedYZ molybdopterin-dependent catalytic subunit
MDNTNESRSRRDLERQMLSEGRLPPGQSLTQKFPVLTYGNNPSYDLSTWDFQVWGEVENPVTLNWQEFIALPDKSITVDIHCVTRWSKFDTTWRGVDVLALADKLGVKSSANYVIAHCDGDYTTNVPIADFLDDDVLLAYEYEGMMLHEWDEGLDHGAPVRTLVPKLYFWKSAKFVRGLEFSTSDQPGFWERAGYHNHGDPFKEERYNRRSFFF